MKVSAFKSGKYLKPYNTFQSNVKTFLNHNMDIFKVKF
jgi:hypothetical protein